MKAELTVQEIFNLSSEIEGVSVRTEKGEQQVIIKGIVNHKLPIVLKYRLYKLIDVINKEKKAFMDIRDKIDSDLSDEEKTKEIQKLALQSVEIEFPEITINDFESMDTEEYYNTFFTKIIG